MNLRYLGFNNPSDHTPLFPPILCPSLCDRLEGFQKESPTPRHFAFLLLLSSVLR